MLLLSPRYNGVLLGIITLLPADKLIVLILDTFKSTFRLPDVLPIKYSVPVLPVTFPDKLPIVPSIKLIFCGIFTLPYVVFNRISPLGTDTFTFPILDNMFVLFNDVKFVTTDDTIFKLFDNP